MAASGARAATEEAKPHCIRSFRNPGRPSNGKGNGQLTGVRQLQAMLPHVSMASFQGISNSVAAGYIKQNGSAHWNDLQIALDAKPSCPKLASYWQFYGCHYAKGSCTCAEPAHLENCPLPALPLRNGSLNKLAYSLFLCIRDLAGDDFVAWIDNQLAIADESPTANRLATMAEAVIGPLRNIHGLSDKVLNMTLATLLLGAGRGKARWVEIGASLICHRYTCA